ncbi:MAG: tol-pal system YbgF family protein, partial [bacterium]
GLPCKNWPEGDEGRCEDHANNSTTQLPDQDSSSSDTSGNTSSPETPVIKSSNYVVFFVILGILSSVTGGYLTYNWLQSKSMATSNSNKTATMKSSTSNNVPAFSSDTEPSSSSDVGRSVSIDPNDPDFSTINQLAEEGKVEKLVINLQSIIDHSNNASDRAMALYKLYVLHHIQKNYKPALETTQKFLDQYDDHHLRPEMLYGAVVSSRKLNRPDTADRYLQQLRNEYPDSKWLKQLSEPSS